MRILYGIQGTGNGHISRAKAIIPLLREAAELDLLISGHSSEVSIGHPIKFQCSGLGYTFGSNGGINYLDTALNLHPVHLVRDIQNLPVNDYDIIISDFEPVTAWACRLHKRECIGLSHQASFLSEKTPRPKARSAFGELIFRNYAPVSRPLGFHFEQYDDFIYTPVIRKEVREMDPSDTGHISIYLPAFHHTKLVRLAGPLGCDVHIFSKQCQSPERHGRVSVFPVNDERYRDSLLSCHALICGAGFEAPAEALFLGKKLMCVPMKDQYEQKCNAESLARLGVRIVENVDDAFTDAVEALISNDIALKMDYPDITAEILTDILQLEFA